MKEVTLVTDGSCKGYKVKGGGAGGWAALLLCDGVEREVVGGEVGTSNNRMELRAVIEGLKALKEPVAVTVITDSKYVINAFEEHWLRNWQRNGWMTNAGPVKNQDLWQELLPLVQRHSVTWKWVRGHSGDTLNERVDALAQAEAEKKRSQVE